MDRLTVARTGYVYFGRRFAGTLDQGRDGYRFIYDSGYLSGGAPLSFRLPLQEDPFDSDELFPFFDNLVSEGWLKQIQSRTQRIDENDRFGLLLENGRDLTGAVMVLKEKHGDL